MLRSAPPRRHFKRISMDMGALRITAAFGVRRRAVAPRWDRDLLRRWTLRAIAAFALVWSIFRAVRQSITLDEADTYLWFGGGQGAKFIWYGFPNNHVLNSLLIWVTTHLFGVSEISVRLPALLGAALYIGVAYFICRAITGRFALQFATLACLVYNPFLLDFFAAARGYSLANAFLLTALAVPLWHWRHPDGSVARSVATASAAIGLSFCSNFSYAFVDAATLLVIFVWAVRRSPRPPVVRLLACCALPALAVSAILAAYPIAHYERTALWYGARSLGEMTKSLVDASLYRLWAPVRKWEVVGPWLLAALPVLCFCRMLAGSLERAFRRDLRARLAVAIAGIVSVTVAAHYLAFRIDGLPMPLSRTAIYFLPLATLLLALIAAGPAHARAPRWIGHATVGVLLCLSAHYVLSLRYTYFKEYEKAAEMREVYSFIERLHQRYGIQEFTSDGAYTSPLNFYRIAFNPTNLPPFPGYPGMVPPGKEVYVVHRWFHEPFMKQHNLAIIYHGDISQVAIAVPKNGRVPIPQ